MWILRSKPRKIDKPVRRRWRRRLVVCALVLLSLPLLAFGAFWAAVLWWPYPPGLDRPPLAGTWIEDRNGRPLAALVGDDGQWCLPLTYEQISPHLRNAIVAVEDSRFYEHGGVDWRSAAGALVENVKAGAIRRGASTIAMQVQRLRDPQPRSLTAKLEQAIRGCQLSRSMTREQILTEYLNRAPFGGNLVGAGAASWRYFSRPCSELSLAQAALLAGLPQSPNRLRPDRHPELALARRNHVLSRMLACGFIDRQQCDDALAEPLEASWRPLPQGPNVGQASSLSSGGDRLEACPTKPLADGAMPTLAHLADQHPGESIRSTLDAHLQRQVAQAAQRHLDQLTTSGIGAIAVVVLNTQNGECLAAVSLSEHAGNVDLTRRPRSTGSALKPFIYAAAFEAGICSPDGIVDDSPAAWAGYLPANYDRQYRGQMSVADALADSRNIPAMVMLGKVGVPRAVGVMESAGLHTLARRPERYGLSLAIGGAEATPMELAEAYATLGRGGMHVPARLILPSGPTEAGSSPCLSPAACRQTMLAISEPQRTELVCHEAARLGVAWKTGTSSGNRDAWCAAVTEQYTIVVWMGNPDGRPSPRLVGQSAAAPLALRLIAALSTGGGTWAAAAPAVAPATQARGSLDRSGIVIVAPSEGQEFVLSGDEASDRQKILLQAAGIGGSPLEKSNRLWWFVDSQPIGRSDEYQQVWWRPAAGPHEIRVVDADGHAAAVRIHVHGG